MTKSKRRRSPARKRQAPPSPRRSERSTRVRPRDRSPITVVGVGASAGGLEALTQLLESLPRAPGLALVLVQHMAPTRDSALPVLLSTHTTMPVVEVTNGVRVQANHVYVIPPNVQMRLADGHLKLLPRPRDRSQHTPIDTFFSSMAEMEHIRPIAVVLSGTASDGALGIREVKAAGGITFAQQPESAKFDSMPRAAIATGMVDRVLTPPEIGEAIVDVAAHPYVQEPHLAREDVTLRDDQLTRIFDLLRLSSGVDFRHYKLPTIRRRLFRRMALHSLGELDQYIKLLQTSQAELRGLFQDLLIHVTRFFREPDSFRALAEHVLPILVEGRTSEAPIRVWVCGCSTGEEAYSLAITLAEFLQKQQSDLRVQIFATDVSEHAIDHARAGVYSASIAGDVGADRLRRFFTKSDGNYRVSKTIRDLCVFARQDLTKDPPFSRLDIVMCRNVLIYMDASLQKKLIALFHYALNPHGFLMLGQAETVGGQASLFSMVDKKHRIHRKKSAPLGASGMGMPVDYASAASPRKPQLAEPAVADKGLQAEVSRIMLERYAPAGVVVDGDLQIMQFRGQTGIFLEPAPGEASLSLLKMAREGLLHGLRTALHSARKTKSPVRKDGLQVRSDNVWRSVAVEVIPLTGRGKPHYLVVFEETARTHKAERMPAPADQKGTVSGSGAKDKAADTKVALLQRELAASREYLQSIIQELEAANEELQSANEEILSSNEELQSTNEELDTAKEELQSTNEELNTLNDELQSRNEEMARVNSDLMNLVSSVQIAIVIVSADLRIRRFTPMAERVLNLIPADLDRSIGHVNPNIDYPNLEPLIVECMESVSLVEREVQDRAGRWYALRIRPYKNMDNKIDGAVLALFDVDIIKRSEQRAELAARFADAVLQSTAQPLAVLGSDLQVQQVNPPFAALFSLTPEELRGRQLADLGGPAWKLDRWSATGRAAGTELPALTIGADPADRWQGQLRVTGRVAPSPDPDNAQVVIAAVDERPSSQRRP